MYKKINLSVSSSLLIGLFVAGCSQQQVNPGSQSAGGQVVGGQQSQAYANAVDIQPAPMIKPSAIDNQIQNIVVPQTVQPYYAPKPRPKPIQRMAKPIQRMAKPVQRMTKPIQRRSVAYTDYRSSGVMPPAKPNQCYAKVRTGPTYKNAVKRVQVSPAVNKRVLVRGPQYAYTNKRVQVRPATHTYRYVPAQYRNISKRVIVKPAHYAWQKGKRGPVTRIDNMTGEILCRVKVPAVYRTVVQKVLARPAQRIKRNIPAVYRTVKQKRLASPAQYRNVHTPARFINKNYRVKTGGTGYKWQPINC